MSFKGSESAVCLNCAFASFTLIWLLVSIIIVIAAGPGTLFYITIGLTVCFCSLTTLLALARCVSYLKVTFESQSSKSSTIGQSPGVAQYARTSQTQQGPYYSDVEGQQQQPPSSCSTASSNRPTAAMYEYIP